MTFKEWWKRHWDKFPYGVISVTDCESAWDAATLDATEAERRVWQAKILKTDADYETIDEKGEGLMALAAAVRKGLATGGTA